MKTFLGIGNYKASYLNTYHSLGIIFVEFLLKKFEKEMVQFKEQTFCKIYMFENFQLIVSKTLMNNSVLALSECKNISQLFVAHDELTIPKYKMKIKTSQGNAGHNGLRSLSTKFSDFVRIQIGIDHPKNFSDSFNVSEYVLSKIDDKEKYLQNFEEFFLKNLNLFEKI